MGRGGQRGAGLIIIKLHGNYMETITDDRTGVSARGNCRYARFVEGLCSQPRAESFAYGSEVRRVLSGRRSVLLKLISLHCRYSRR
jgi:hypothetical protein